MTSTLGQRWARRKYNRLLASMAGPKLIAAFGDAYPSAFFVEIGANDGAQHDHLRPMILEHDWHGIMVEPVPYVFARLQANYGTVAGVTLENAAIAARDGTLPFFHLAEASAQERPQLPGWYDAIGSFSREAIAGHARDIPDIEDRIVEVQVPALTFESLLARHGVERVDLILIDTEGYDWEIIRHLDLARHKPRLLVYEHYHLSREDRAACRAYVEAAGYETIEEGFDTFCLDATAEDRLTRTWRGLRPAVAGVAAYEEPDR